MNKTMMMNLQFEVPYNIAFAFIDVLRKVSIKITYFINQNKTSLRPFFINFPANFEN